MIGNIRHFCIRMSNVRHLNTSSSHRFRYTPKENPGVYRRLKVIAEDEPDIQRAGIDYDSMEDLEQDFMQAEEMHDEVMDKMKQISKATQFKMTERRYFRSPKEPGMLTWSEKEQIRHLHQKDPEKWTAEMLAESFPASPTIIKKILKFKWKPESVERLKAHDHKVSENWKAFHKGQLEIHDLKLKAHLAKFTDRKNGVKIVSDEEAAKIVEVIYPKPKRTEFLSIITSFKQTTISNETKVKEIEDNSHNTKQIESTNQVQRFDNNSHNINQIESTNKLQRFEDYSHNIQKIDSTYQPQRFKGPELNYTLDQYCRKLEDELDKMTDSPQEIKAIIKSKEQANIKSASSSEMYIAPSERYKTEAIVFRRSRKSPLILRDLDTHPFRIRIPKEERKKGSLYKVNDCFYNDNGYFLYKVPGLKS